MTTDEGFPDTTDPGPLPEPTMDSVNALIDTMKLTDFERTGVVNYCIGYAPRAVSQALEMIQRNRDAVAAHRAATLLEA